MANGQDPQVPTHVTINPSGFSQGIKVPVDVLGDPQHLKNLSRAIVSHPQYQVPTAPDITAPVDYSDLNIPSQPNLSAENAIENHPDFREAVQRAWDRTQRGRLPQAEAGFTVDQKGNISHVDFDQRSSDANAASLGSLHQKITPGETLLALHVHPNDGTARPDAADIAAAKKTKTPIYVQSRDGLFAVDAQGNIRQIFSDSNWMNQTKGSKK